MMKCFSILIFLYWGFIDAVNSNQTTTCESVTRELINEGICKNPDRVIWMDQLSIIDLQLKDERPSPVVFRYRNPVVQNTKFKRTNKRKSHIMSPVRTLFGTNHRRRRPAARPSAVPPRRARVIVHTPVQRSTRSINSFLYKAPEGKSSSSSENGPRVVNFTEADKTEIKPLTKLKEPTTLLENGPRIVHFADKNKLPGSPKESKSQDAERFKLAATKPNSGVRKVTFADQKKSPVPAPSSVRDGVMTMLQSLLKIQPNAEEPKRILPNLEIPKPILVQAY